MMQIEELQAEIELLPQDKFVLLRKWFAEKDWERWDEQLEQDSLAGKLDFLLQEAETAKAKSKLREL
jgi:uncharacterized membrane protein YbaN (DUF454 family)